MVDLAKVSPKRAKMSPATAESSHNSSISHLPVLRVKKLNENGRAPERASAFAAGYDISSAIDIIVPAKGKALVSTGISLAIPDGHYGRVAPRSSLAVKNFIDVGAGVIDCDYRGPLGVVLFNFGDEEFVVKKGDRIAQLIITPIATPRVEVVEELDVTERGQGGFGSTGLGSLNKQAVENNATEA